MTETKTSEAREFLSLYSGMDHGQRIKAMTLVNAVDIITRLTPAGAASFNAALTAMGQMAAADSVN